MHEVVLKVAVEDERLVFAEVYAPNILDTDGEFMTAPEIKKAAYKFMQSLSLKSIDVQHDNNLVDGACVVESFIARAGDPEFIEDSWVVGIHVDNDDVWAAIKAGEINGFSMQAEVYREEATLEMVVPPVITGETSTAEDGHKHDFYVTYDAEGNFVGGVTGRAEDGHSHKIVRGTITEDTNSHHHMFSFVENLVV